MTDVEVAIIGAGFGGIAAALALHEAGIASFSILERATRVGGTWRDNTYPGISCDIPSHLYSFKGHPNAFWSREFAPGREIQDYLEEVVHKAGISDKTFLSTPLQRARWTGSHWRLSTGGAELAEITAQSLVIACGRLAEPRIPNVAGLSTFAGPIMHTARWDRSVQLRGLRCAVIGTGASAVQLVPELVRMDADVVLFQRTPAWIMPRESSVFTRDQQERWASNPEELRLLRHNLEALGEERFASRAGDPVATSAAESVARAHLARQVHDPGMRKALTPRYAYGCKRVLLSDDFYPELDSGNVQLEPSALEGISGATLQAASGRSYEADVLIFATGFETQRQGYANLVEGEDGILLADHWANGMTSLGSTLVSGFPDMYVLNGPNAALGHNSSILMLEAQAEFAAKLMSSRSAPVRIRTESETSYTAEIAERSAGTSWMAEGCSSWYVDSRSGRLTLLWPGTVQAFRDRLSLIGPDDFQSVESHTPFPTYEENHATSLALRL